MTVVMWEVRAAEGRAGELIAFVLAHADPSAQVYRSSAGSSAREERVVVIDPTGQGIADVPAELVARPPHAWRFDPVPRDPGGVV